jgi:uncharacterized DUF497 family protein
MEITVDPQKDEINKAKHGVSLADAAYLEWDGVLVWADERKEYGELRQSGLGMIKGRVYFVAFVDRNEERRIISFRKANYRETKHYESQTQDYLSDT